MNLYHIYNFPLFIENFRCYFVDYQYLPKFSLIVGHLEFNSKSESSQDILLVVWISLCFLGKGLLCASLASSVNGDYASQSCFIKGVNLSKALRTVPDTAFTQKVLSILGKSIKSMENYCERLQNGPKDY